MQLPGFPPPHRHVAFISHGNHCLTCLNSSAIEPGYRRASQFFATCRMIDLIGRFPILGQSGSGPMSIVRGDFAQSLIDEI